MKIQITQTVNIDPEKWATEYDIALSDVRKDVKAYFSDGQERVIQLGLDNDDQPKPPYPFCHTPKECAGKGHCPREYACNN